MTKFLNIQVIARIILVTCCLALINRSSNALLLGNFIGCNSFGCRLSALENDVNMLKQQVARLSPNSMDQMNQYRPMNQNGYNQIPNGINNQQDQLNNNNNQNQNQNQQQNNQNGNNANRVNYANLLQTDYPAQQQNQLRRVNGYPNQIFRA